MAVVPAGSRTPMSSRSWKALLVLAAFGAYTAAVPTRAQDAALDRDVSPVVSATTDETSVEAALAAVVSADVELRTWARAETVDTDFRRDALEGLLPEGAPDVHRTGGELAGQRALA